MSTRRLPGLGPIVLGLSACQLLSGGHGDYPVVSVDPSVDLPAMFDTLRGPALVELGPGDYHLAPAPYTDPSCGNCQDPTERIPATRGLRVSGTGIHVRGASSLETVIHTNAGYGVLFEDCDSCSLASLTVTGGVRDPDGRATDAGVVVRGGRVTLSDCTIRDNLGDSAVVHTVVVGIAGVAVREGGDVLVEDCLIERNSWDGIAAYRGAGIEARGNVVDGVDQASGAAMGGGRGVGIGLTWDARGFIEGNRVTRYWKGIGVFVDARAEVAGNVVEDMLTWGIAYWGPNGGEPVAWIHDNVVFQTGACGVSIDRQAPFEPAGQRPEKSGGPNDLDRGGPGSLRDNILVRTGQDERYDSGEPYCFQRAIARHNVPPGFVIRDNLVHDVRQPGEEPSDSVIDRIELRERGRALLDLMASRRVLAESRFMGAFGGLRGR